MAESQSDKNKMVSSLMGVVLLILAVLAVLSYLGIIIPTSLFGGLAVITVSAALIAAYFGWTEIRSALLFSAAAAVIVAGVFYLGHPAVKQAQYQAVFLSNGQVYFGHLKSPESGNPVLEDVYYLQSNQQNPQQGKQAEQQNQLSLVKLGNELHGPETKMVINRDQILFWENLKDSGKVVQAIKENKKK